MRTGRTYSLFIYIFWVNHVICGTDSRCYCNEKDNFFFFFSFRSVCLLRKWKKNKTLDGTWHFVLVCNRCVAQDSNEVGRVLVLGSVE